MQRACDGRACKGCPIQLTSVRYRTDYRNFCHLKWLANFRAGARFISIEPEPSRNMTADECEELAALLLEDAAALPPGQKQGEILKLAFGYRDLAKMKRMVFQNVN